MKTRLLTALLVFAVSGPAFAQDTPAIEVSGGYSLLRDQTFEENFHGWVASVAVNANRWLGVAGEVEGAYKSYDILGESLDLDFYSFTVGPRLSARTNRTVTPFAHVLVGATRIGMNMFDESDSTTKFAMQPGGGVDIWMSQSVGIRGGFDYRRVFVREDGLDGLNQYRMQIGVVIGGGRR